MARLVQLEIRQSRYFGRIKTRFQLYLAATVANLTLLAAKAGLTANTGGGSSAGSALRAGTIRSALEIVPRAARSNLDPGLACVGLTAGIHFPEQGFPARFLGGPTNAVATFRATIPPSATTQRTSLSALPDGFQSVGKRQPDSRTHIDASTLRLCFDFPSLNLARFLPSYVWSSLFSSNCIRVLVRCNDSPLLETTPLFAVLFSLNTCRFKDLQTFRPIVL